MSGDLLKRFPNAPRGEELITPVLRAICFVSYGDVDAWAAYNEQLVRSAGSGIYYGEPKQDIELKLEVGSVNASGLLYAPDYELEAGDFDPPRPAYHFGRMSLWQRIKHRFWVWRTRRRVKRQMGRKNRIKMF